MIARHTHLGEYSCSRVHPEPFFNIEPAGITSDILEDWLHVLSEENERLMKSSSSAHNANQGYLKGGYTAEFIFLACHKFNLGAEQKYIAVELYDRFMIKHLINLYEHSKKYGHSADHWENTLANVCSRLVLRAASCVQIASKLVAHHKKISVSKVQRFLNEVDAETDYSKKMIVSSEIRVLKTLGFRVLLLSPLLFVETLLKILGHNIGKLDIKLYHTVSLQCLDLHYMKRRFIYDRLIALASGGMRSDNRNTLLKIERDLMTLACSVISTSSYLTDLDNSDMVMRQLSNITKIPVTDILDFTTTLVTAIQYDK